MKRVCTNLTTDLESAYLIQVIMYIHHITVDYSTMSGHLSTYQNMAGGEGPNQAWYPDSSNYTWIDHYGGKWCRDFSTSTPEFHSCIDLEGHQPSGWVKASGAVTNFDIFDSDHIGDNYAWNRPSDDTLIIPG